jgi:hypothetical protein
MSTASKKQIFYIEKLVEEIKKEGGEVPDYVEDFLNDSEASSYVASSIIDDLKDLLGWEGK